MAYVDLRSFFKDGAVFFGPDIEYLREYLDLSQMPDVLGRKERMAQLKNILEDIVDFDQFG